MNSQLILGQVLSVIIAICWSQNSIIYTILGRSYNTDSVAHIRLWIAVPLMFLVSLIFNGSLFPLGFSPKTYLLLLASGVFGFFITDVLMYRAYHFIGPREGQSIQTLNPCLTAIMAYFLVGERLNASQLLGMVITITGLLIMFYPDLAADRKLNKADLSKRKKGILYAVGAAFFQALALVIIKMGDETIDPYSQNLLRALGGLVSISLYCSIVRKSFRRDFSILKEKKAALLLTSAALLGPVIGMCLEMKAFTLAPIGVVTAITQISPILLLPVDKFYFHKKVPFISIVGTVISIAGVTLLFLY